MGNSFKTCLSLGTQSLKLWEDDEGVYNPTIRGWCHLYTHRTGYTVYLITYICLISLWFSCRQIYRSSHGCHLSRKNMLVNLPIPWSICYRDFPTSNFSNRFFFRSKPSKISKLKGMPPRGMFKVVPGSRCRKQPVGSFGAEGESWTYNPPPQNVPQTPTPQKSRVYNLRRL